jgi:hypothetical protein
MTEHFFLQNTLMDHWNPDGMTLYTLLDITLSLNGAYIGDLLNMCVLYPSCARLR